MLLAHAEVLEALPPLTTHTAFSEWELDPWLLTGLLLACGLYVAGVVRLHRRGHHWGAGRTISFLVGGLGTIAIATLSSLGAYDDTLFTVHMIQHMILSMVSPVFLALGAPITLALRAAPKRPRRVIVRVLHSRFARLVTWPPIAWLHFVALPFVVYNSPWYQATLEHDSLHELLHVQFLVGGCMFLWPALGLDPMPRRMSHPVRMFATALALPTHAILGLTIMMNRGIIAGHYYRALGRTWGPTLAHDQYTGGGVIWGSGDLVGLLLFGTMFYQWQRADRREQRRADRALDRAAAAAAVTAPAPAGLSRGSVPAQPVLTRPWWETDPGPLAERARREHWAVERPDD